MYLFWFLIIFMTAIALSFIAFSLPPLRGKVRMGGKEYCTENLSSILLLVIFPIISISLYFYWGNSNKLNQFYSSAKKIAIVKQEITRLGSREKVIATLKSRLQQSPESARGWYLLGKLYISNQQLTEAENAFETANRLNPNDADTKLAYAETLFFIHQHTLTPEAEQLIHEVIKVRPDDVNAINLIALNEYQQHHYQEAIHYWEHLLTFFPTDSNESKTLLLMIAKSQQLRDIKNPKNLKITVTITNSFKKYSQDKVLYVYALSKKSKIPVAVKRLKSDHFPTMVVLGDEDAMTNELTLSTLEKVKVIARLSESGDAMTHSGDVEGNSNWVDLNQGDNRVNIIMNHVVN